MPKDMVSLAAHILETKTAHFDPRKFKDEYETALKKLVRRKAKGKPIEPPPAEREEGDNVINLMEALRASLGKRAAKKHARSKPKTRARKAA
jgi:DNA end-binding protein Ku